ncbi:MAG: cytochrome P450 [Brevundimonas sp.]
MARTDLPRMSFSESAAFVSIVALPVLAKGVIIRRKAVVGLAEKAGTDSRAVKLMQRLRAKHGDGPLLVRNPVRPQAILLRDEDVRRVLEGAPEPFSPASREKRAALSHFEPHGSLITRGPTRATRRAFNDDVLESGCPIHRSAADFSGVVEQEAERLLRNGIASGALDWDAFFDSWMRIVRRVVLGAGARDDDQLTRMIVRLRRRANWAFAARRNRGLREAFHLRLQSHLDRAEPGSLAFLIGRRSWAEATEPAHQVAQWLFAFDPGGMATYRCLALLVAHADKLDKARSETTSARDFTHLPFLRAAVVETLRLYPTTPMVLRQTTHATEWPGGTLPKGSGVLIFAPFFHRDDERLATAHRFHPESWLNQDPAHHAPLIPFSAGPAACPARHLVPLIAGAFLACILRRIDSIALEQIQRLDPARPLPGTLDPYSLRFTIAPS